MGATCPLAEGTLQGGLSTWHVKCLVKARLPASRAENRLNRQNMFEQNNVNKNLCIHYQTGYLWVEKTSSFRGSDLHVPPQKVWFLGLVGLKTGKHFAYFGLESRMVFEGTTGMNVP